MPPLHSGDSGDGHGEDEPDDGDDVGFRPPLPRDDRLWRHPSEVALERSARTVPSAAAESTAPWTTRTAALLVAAGMIGATFALGAVAALGGFDTRVVEQQVAVAPITASGDGDDPVAAVAARTASTVAALRVHRGNEVVQGSAVAFRSDGHLLTTGRLIDGADTIEVALHDGPVGEATVVGIDPVTDVGVLRIDQDDLRSAAFGSSDDLAVGTRCVVVGASSEGGWDSAVSTGVVSATGRRLQRPDGAELIDMILVDAPFAAGAAGGALVDSSGAVVGIANGFSAPGADESRFGAATPIDVAHLVADQLIAHGEFTHVWLGIYGTDLDAGDAAAMAIPGAARVDEVVSDSPAEHAGLEAGDIIVGVDDDDVTSMADLVARLRRHLPGDEVALQVQRGDEVLELPVTLGAKETDG